jgi:dynein heavy chain
MYGGHITDDWDRRCNSTYLLKLIKPEILQQMQLTMTAGFKSPIPEKFDRERYEEYIEKSLPAEIPQMFGLHPNAEIGYLTTQANALFNYIQQIQGGSSAGGGDDGASEVFAKIYKFQEMCPETFQMLDLFARATERPPFIVVCLQECERMNKLLVEIKSSLSDLDAGLKGTLNITESMEKLAYALNMNQIPPGWQACAYLSKKALLIWLEDLILRCAQLERWSEEFITPTVLWLSALFNPMSFLTAIMQITARATNQPLDEMCLRSDVTNHYDITELTEYPETGSYVNGFTLEGAGWEAGRNGE